MFSISNLCEDWQKRAFVDQDSNKYSRTAWYSRTALRQGKICSVPIYTVLSHLKCY